MTADSHEQQTSKPDVPQNIQEFNIIAGLIFAQLYARFPLPVALLDREEIGKKLPSDWITQMPSGRSFNEVLAYTNGWLNAEGYIRSYGAHAAERVTLTTKGLAAMNAVPSGLQQSIGTAVTAAVEGGSSVNYSSLGDLIGGFFGGYTKSMSS